MLSAQSHWKRFHVVFFAVAGFLATAGAPLRSLEIPLKRGTNQATRVGFVDMDKIFREYPETQKARADYYKALEKRRSELASREKELASLDGPGPVGGTSTPPAVSTGLFSLPLELTPPAASTGTAAVAPPAPPDPEEREAERRQKREEIAAARASAARELKELEEKKSVQILGALYKTLVQLAQEKGVDLVVDKSAILYGQSAIDLTEPLARRLRGLPDDGKP
ncbi:MAG: OmpH family outer membrane protein [Elusimicrobia bacterium]|nr:OmpH family outer membrane protein [Elusimicrobiota bacterium]